MERGLRGEVNSALPGRLFNGTIAIPDNYPGYFYNASGVIMLPIPDDLLSYYDGIKPRMGYVYYFLDENLKKISRDQLKIGLGFYRSEWLDGVHLFECDSYLLKSLKEYLAAIYLRKGGFPIWAEWTEYYTRLWGAVGFCRLMGTGSFYLTGQGSTMILRKRFDEIPGPVDVEIAEVEGHVPTHMNEGYLVYRDPGGGAHLRNWKLFYLVLTELLAKTGVFDFDDDYIRAMSQGDADGRFVIKKDEAIYGFPSFFMVKQLSQEEKKAIDEDAVPDINHWIENEAQFDAGGFTEEFKAYYLFMMDHYARTDGLPEPLSILEHGLTWLLEVLPDDLRPKYRKRYYDLVTMYSRDESTEKLLHGWLDTITAVKK